MVYMNVLASDTKQTQTNPNHKKEIDNSNANTVIDLKILKR